MIRATMTLTNPSGDTCASAAVAKPAIRINIGLEWRNRQTVQCSSNSSRLGNGGNFLCGKVWYQNATEAMSSCSFK
jgi:hypothetical protein